MIQTVDPLAGFVPVSVSTLVPDSFTGIRLYLQDSEDHRPQLYCAEDVHFEQSHLDRLQRAGRHTVCISAGDHERYQAYLRENLTTILDDESVTVRERFSALNLVVRDVLAVAFRDSAKDPQVERMRELASVAVDDLLLRDDFVARDVLGVLRHDYKTFTHSTNVAFYCVMLAKALGIGDAETLREIALGGFLHDLGKLLIPERILNKPDRPTQDEWEIIRQHPRTGFEKLAHRDDLSRGQLMMVN
ncbi:MAG: HD-GYP domain-containing protein, partial [Planctomycetaceae bacterium]